MNRTTASASHRAWWCHCAAAAALLTTACTSTSPATATGVPANTSVPLAVPADGKVPVAFLLSPGAEVVDFAGPWGVFEYADPAGAENPFTLFTVAEQKQPFAVSGGMVVVPNHSFADAPQPRVIVVPAMGPPSPALLDWLRRTAPRADLAMSVCNGSFVLAEAGLLAGRKATSHHGALTMLAASHPDVEVIRGARFVEDGPVATAGGLTSGTDLALRVVERYLGRAAAERTAFALEYQGQGWKDAASNQIYRPRPPLTGPVPRCPICEGELDRATVPPQLRVDFDGRTYFFCCADCKALFEKSPAKFAHP